MSQFAAAFLCTGVLTTTVAQLVVYAGAGNQVAGLLVFSTFLGMSSMGLLTKVEQLCCGATPKAMQLAKSQAVDDVITLFNFRIRRSRTFIIVACLEVSGIICSMIGMEFAGSGLFQVAHASTIVWSALLSVRFLGKAISRAQWAGVACIMGGLSLTALGPMLESPSAPTPLEVADAKAAGTDPHAEGDEGGGSSRILLGLGVSVLGSLFFAMSAVCAETATAGSNGLKPAALATMVGGVAALATGSWVALVTVPRWDALVTAPMVRAGGNAQWVIGLFAAYALLSGLHTLFYYKLVVSSGGVVVGVVQGMRAVGVFVVAALLFCSRQDSQCFSFLKALATVVVVAGVLQYVRASGKPAAAAAAAVQGSAASGQAGGGLKPGVVLAEGGAAPLEVKKGGAGGVVDVLGSSEGVVLA